MHLCRPKGFELQRNCGKNARYGASGGWQAGGGQWSNFTPSAHLSLTLAGFLSLSLKHTALSRKRTLSLSQRVAVARLQHFWSWPAEVVQQDVLGGLARSGQLPRRHLNHLRQTNRRTVAASQLHAYVTWLYQGMRASATAVLAQHFVLYPGEGPQRALLERAPHV
jgi:hypothetical protein